MNLQQTRRKPDIWKITLICASVAILATGLFPPWLYTFYRTGTSDASGSRSENSAGYYFIFMPPPPENYYPAYGVKLDMERLLVEWACILVVSGAAWTIFGTQKPTLAYAPATDEKAAPIPFDKDDFKSDPQIYRALETLKRDNGKVADLPESPRMHHYNFAYKALPGLVFADPLVALGFGHDTPEGSLIEFWKYVGTKVPEDKRIIATGLSAIDIILKPDHVMLMVEMPEPLRDTEAYFVAVIYPKSWLNNPAQENENPDLNYFILAKSEVPASQGDAGGTLRMLTKTGHGAVKFGVPFDAEIFIKEIRSALLKPPQFTTWVESKPWNFFMHDTETGETFGAD
jgi:hypothetical protein